MISDVTCTAILLVVFSHVVPSSQSTCLTSHANVTLRDHVIKSFSTSFLNECWQTCKSDARCQSLNFFLEKQLCEINNRTITLAPKHSVQVPFTSYFDNPYKVAIGTTKDLPVVSCAEILKTVGNVSGRYWIVDHAQSSLPFKAYCNMTRLAIEECAVEQCKNGGKCTYFGLGKYECACPVLTTGRDCQIKISVCDSAPCLNGATCVDQGSIFSCSCKFRFYGNKCVKECTSLPALGMESGSIPNSRITASSVWDINHDAWLARLNKHFPGKMGAWSAKTNVAGQWILVDIGKETVVTRLATQGRADTTQWVTSYYLEYRTDTAYYIPYEKRKVFSGNRDRTTVVTHNLNPPIIGRWIKLVVQSWYGHISLRMEIYGCL